jgi:hypothetical protein
VVLPFMMLGIVGQLGSFGIVGVGLIRGEAASSATLRARSTTCLSGEDCVGVCGEPCGVKVGDTASSSIRVAHSTLCSRERDEVDSIIDKSNGRSPVRSGCQSVIVTIYVDHIGGWVRSVSECFYRFGLVQSVRGSLRLLMIFSG